MCRGSSNPSNGLEQVKEMLLKETGAFGRCRQAGRRSSECAESSADMRTGLLDKGFA
jgi:hypothetical protein